MTSRISGWCITPATGRFTAAVRLLGYVDCLSRVPGDWYARFCGEGVIAISSPYPTTIRVDDTEYRRGGQEDPRPVVMRLEETKEPRPLGQAWEQRSIVARQPPIERPVPHAFKGM